LKGGTRPREEKRLTVSLKYRGTLCPQGGFVAKGPGEEEYRGEKALLSKSGVRLLKRIHIRMKLFPAKKKKVCPGATFRKVKKKELKNRGGLHFIRRKMRSAKDGIKEEARMTTGRKRTAHLV